MPAPSESELVSFAGRTFRVRPAQKHPARLLLLIHGLKGDENSMWVFAGGLPAGYWIVAPRAPHAVDSGGYTWRLRQSDEISRPELETLRPAADRLLEALTGYAATIGLVISQFDAMGFSQGATMTAALMLLYPDRVRKAALLSGFLPGDVDAYPDDQPLQGKQVFIAHGTRDETIPVQEARTARQWFERAGASMTYCEDDVGHKVSATCLRELKAFFGE